MQTSEIERLMSSISATAEIMGTKLQPAAITIMVEDLSEYPLNSVLSALKRCRQEISGRLTLAAIIERVHAADGIPGADEAWALASRGEGETIVITEQIAEAMSIVRPLLNDGDSMAARMSFREVYTRIVQEARSRGVKARWFISLGHDRLGRSQAIAEAVRANKVGIDHALSLLSPDEKLEVLKLTGNTNHPLLQSQVLIEDKTPSIDPAEGLKRIAAIKEMFSRKSAAALEGEEA